MPVAAELYPEHNLIFIRYTGLASASETVALLTEITQKPEFQNVYLHLMDMSELVSYETGLPGFYNRDDSNLEKLIASPKNHIMVYLAPNAASQALAELASRKWRDKSRVTSLIVPSEREALAALGLQDLSLSELVDDLA